jgi:hypothetical protein
MDLIRLYMVAEAAAADWFIRTFFNDVPLEAYGRHLFERLLVARRQ